MPSFCAASMRRPRGEAERLVRIGATRSGEHVPHVGAAFGQKGLRLVLRAVSQLADCGAAGAGKAAGAAATWTAAGVASSASPDGITGTAGVGAAAPNRPSTGALLISGSRVTKLGRLGRGHDGEPVADVPAAARLPRKLNPESCDSAASEMALGLHAQHSAPCGKWRVARRPPCARAGPAGAGGSR